MDIFSPTKRAIVRGFEEAVGRHDEPEIYGGPPGDPGLIGPDSVSWELHSDIGTIAAAGLGAIIMEILHPAVMAGVHSQSSYRTETFRRARNTFGYVVVTTFGSTEAATRMITRVRRMHEQVNGVTPDGHPYRAMDPTLIGWVHTAIPWAIMEAHHRYRRPLSVEEKNRYLAEQAIIGRLGGAGDIPVTVSQLYDYVEAMRPHLAVNEQTVEFIDFLAGWVKEGKSVNRLEWFLRRLALHGSMHLMPEWAQRLTGLYHAHVFQRWYFDPTTRFNANLIRWAFGTPPFRALADARIAAGRATRTRPVRMNAHARLDQAQPATREGLSPEVALH